MNQKITTSIIAKAKELKLAGKTIAEIASELEVNPHTIQYYLRNTKVRSQKKLTDEQKEQILALSGEGLSTYKIADKLDLPQSTVYACIKKEKEPATAATVTDSVSPDVKTDVCTVSISNDNTDAAKSQALSPFTALTLLEALLDNWVGNEYDEYYMQAYEGVAEFIFTYKGRKYAFEFKECKGDDEK